MGCMKGIWRRQKSRLSNARKVGISLKGKGLSGACVKGKRPGEEKRYGKGGGLGNDFRREKKRKGKPVGSR